MAEHEREKGTYSLPELRYGFGALQPFLSEEQLRVHHDKHHQKYVNNANALLEKLDKARSDGTMLNMKCEIQALSFNVGGHHLHSLFWKNLAPQNEGGGKRPEGRLAEVIDGEYGSYERFQKEFTELANSVESSGWAAMVYCTMTNRPLLMQIKDHHLYTIPGFRVLLVLDMWEHAFYIDYRNEKTKYTDNFWKVVNWEEVSRRLDKVVGVGEKEERVRKTVPEAVSAQIPTR